MDRSPDIAETTPQPPADQAVPLLIFVRELMFSSKIVATARAEGVEFRVVRDVSKLMTTSADRLMIDLNAPAAVEQAIAWKRAFGGRVIGFVAHVDTATLAAARAGGVDQVLTNGAFTAKLADLVK